MKPCSCDQGEGVAASAACVYSANISEPFVWYQGDSAVDMGSSLGRSCFITFIGGDFDGGKEYVQIYRNDEAHWMLSGSSGQSGIQGEAICFEQ